MASHYHSDHSGSSAQSAEQTGTGSLPRPQPRSLTDGFIVSQNRTRIPSSYGPLGQSTGFSTAAALLAAEESGTSSTHDAEVPINYSPSTNVGPALSASRDAGDRTTLRIYREPFVIRPDTSFIPSNVETSEVRGYITRAASEISPNLQNLTDTFDSLASESSVSGGRSRVVSSGSITTSNRDFSSSSSNSQGALGPAQALEQFNIYARQQGLTVIEDDIEDEETASPTEASAEAPTEAPAEALTQAPLSQNRAVRFLKKSGSRTQMALSSFSKALKRTASRPNLLRLNLHTGRLSGKTIEELGMVGISGMYLPHEFAVGELLIPTFLVNLMIYINISVDKSKIFAANGSESVVNRLCNYFASQFPRANDQRTYEQGAASTLLPQHFEYGVIDVAQVLKRITNGLKCGLLGSVSLFEALASICKNFSDADARRKLVQAKLIALAITSVTSIRRKSFIIAFLGLSSMIGHEALNASNNELMTFKNLGIVLGPCLLGDKKTFVIKLDVQPRTEADTKFAQFSVTTDVFEMLTSMWKEIVQQLRVIEHGGDLHIHPARLARVLEAAQVAYNSRTTSERPLQHGNRVDRRIVNSSQAASSSQSEGYSSAESNVQHHASSNIGDRRLLQTPSHHDPEGSFQQRLRDGPDFSSQRNEPTVRSGNVNSSQAASASPSEGYSGAESSVRRDNIGYRGPLPHVSPPIQEQSTGNGQDTSARRNDVRSGNNPGSVSRVRIPTGAPSAATDESLLQRNHTRLEENVGHYRSHQPLPTRRNFSRPLPTEPPPFGFF